MIVMEVQSGDNAGAGAEGLVHDPAFRRILVAFNARPLPHLLPWPAGGRPGLHGLLIYDSERRPAFLAR